MGLLGPQGDANLVTNLFLVPRHKQTWTLLLFAPRLTGGRNGMGGSSWRRGKPRPFPPSSWWCILQPCTEDVEACPGAAGGARRRGSLSRPSARRSSGPTGANLCQSLQGVLALRVHHLSVQPPTGQHGSCGRETGSSQGPLLLRRRAGPGHRS